MAGVSLQYDLTGLEKIARRSHRVAERMRDPRPMLDEIGAALVTSTRQRFEDGRGPDGEAWPKSIRVREIGGQTLVEQGHLRDSITYKAGSDSVEVGTNLVYAAIHQRGGEIAAKTSAFLHFKVGGRWARKKKVTIPARRYLGLSIADEREITDIVADYLTEPLR